MKLREARKLRRLSQADFAETLGVTQALISQWESGVAVPSREHRARLEELLPGIDLAMEFEPLDDTEQLAAFRFAAHLAYEVSEDAAIRLVFRSTKYELRRLLKNSGRLPPDYRPATAEVLLPPGLH
jgi:transcriptional regulator with XRE-family HTH domain